MGQGAVQAEIASERVLPLIVDVHVHVHVIVHDPFT
jgi:hypothetical protein